MTEAEEWLPFRDAWQSSLYGAHGFYRRARPADHFRTSVHASPLFAGAILELVQRLGCDTVVDLGAGSGELLSQLNALDPALRLVAVEVRPQPGGVPDHVVWRDRLPDRIDGLLLANELLDNVPCDVVERDPRGELRLVDVHPSSGRTRLGALAPPDVAGWIERWWPLPLPGDRAEAGLARDAFWRGACAHVGDGLALAIDYGHVRGSRPRPGTLTSYRSGRQVALCLDGSADVTAHVAVDAVAAAVHGVVVTQRGALQALGVTGRRPPLTMATGDPAHYVRGLARASEAAELTASPGFGDFSWLCSSTSQEVRHVLRDAASTAPA